MGNSVISWLRKIKDGLVFHEDFENDYFLTAQGWVTVQGTPEITYDQAKLGVRSFDCSVADRPVIKKVLVDTCQYASVWFYDDSSNTTGNGPYFKVKFSGGQFSQVGVRNSVSTTHYCYGDPTEDNFSLTSSISRTTAWHKFEITKGHVIGQTDFIIDGTVVGSVGFTGYITEVYICSDVVPGSGVGFGYFDEAVCCSDVSLKVLQTTDKTGTLYHTDYSSPDNQNPSADIITFSVIGTTDTYPLERILRIKGTKGILCQLPPTDFYPGDIYINDVIAFERKFNTFLPIPSSYQNRSESPDGHSETLRYGFKEKVNFSMVNIEGIEWYEAARNWFSHAELGNPFSIMVDEEKAALNYVTASTGAGTKSIPVNYFSDFSADDECIIEAANHSNKQLVTLNYVGGSPITIDEYTEFDLAVGDTVRSFEFYPYMELDGNTLGISFNNPAYYRFNWIQAIREYIPR